MSDRGVVRGARWRSISESGQPGLNSTSINNDLVFNDNDLTANQNNLSHQSQQIISRENPEGYIESPMWVGATTSALWPFALWSFVLVPFDLVTI